MAKNLNNEKMKITKRKIKKALRRFWPEPVRNLPLGVITCIRHTITWRCNYMCTSCDIWKIEKPKESGKPHRIKDEVTPDDVARMCKSPVLQDVDEVIISGGEPLIRADFVELMLAYHENLPKATFGITINGYDPERVDNLFGDIQHYAPKFKWHVIGVSLNGTRHRHNLSRGLDCYDAVIDTAKVIKRYTDNPAFSFTFLEENVQDYAHVKKIADAMGLSVHVCWTVMNERFVARKKDLVFQDNPDLVPVLEEYCNVAKIKETGDVKKDFMKYKPEIRGAYLYDSILNQRVMPCFAGDTFFHMGPYGDVYPCNFKLTDDRILGNIKDKPIGDILEYSSEFYDEILRGECMFPNGSLCGDSDINRSIQRMDSVPLGWYTAKREFGEKLIKIG